MSDAEKWVKAMAADKVPQGDIARWDYEGHSHAIFRTDNDEYYATDNVCTHEFAHISDGYLEGTTVECPRHAGCFDIRSGEALNPPVCVNLRTFPIKIEDGSVYVNVATPAV